MDTYYIKIYITYIEVNVITIQEKLHKLRDRPGNCDGG